MRKYSVVGENGEYTTLEEDILVDQGGYTVLKYRAGQRIRTDEAAKYVVFYSPTPEDLGLDTIDLD